MSKRLISVALTSVIVVLSVGACGNGGDDTGSSVVDRAAKDKKLVIGVKADQPGLGLRTPDGSFTGFDIDVAKYVAKELGVDQKDITFKEAVSANREAFLQQGQVDMVVATYSINDARKQKVAFAGPYLIAGQDLLVRKDNKGITGPKSLNGKKLCSVAGSTSAQLIKDKYAKDVQLQEERTYSACVDRVLTGQLDAVTTDNSILYGYAAQHPDKLRVLDSPFSEEKYGIGLKKDDKKGRDAVNDALAKMVSDGSWDIALKANLPASGFPVPRLERY
ncbi:glutamate ABC transporter substrate-binding protein [Streptomyces neyagawaensis]|uniref:glutamate ABC transporter substrate-binding protein n=1 Tax=Streptomyces neyagawaensis TaxID=42238 RepID=UPI0006E421E9|nr:glutamate ABC transporter substrate-binding protein [Streptomyces neyagawaensis]MCL6735182.1 glutamate ABC transporter substrate-binding protein [Streptomyces neyagawaensis]MDE1688464.1 glutamate ABC transporter substrate-binding protein [Streptomyces neyagawaensis]